VAYVAAAVRAGVHAGPEAPTMLFLISTYGVGKERILSAAAAAAGCAVRVSPDKLGALACLGLADMDIYTTDASAAPLHVVQWGALGETWCAFCEMVVADRLHVLTCLRAAIRRPYFKPNWAAMEAARAQAGVDRLVGFVPTGWMHTPAKAAKGEAAGDSLFPVRRKGACEVHLVPYSEHSSYDELRRYVRWLRPTQVVPTVGVGAAAAPGKAEQAAAAAMAKHFRNLVDETSAKRAFLGLPQPSPEPAAADEDDDVAAASASEEDEEEPAHAAARTGGAAAAAGAATATAQAAAAQPAPAAAAGVVVIDDDDDDAPASPEDAAVAALRAVLGEAAVSAQRAAALLRASGGDVTAAANAHFDSAAAAQRRPAPSPASASGGGKGAKRPRDAAAASGAAQRSIRGFFSPPPPPRAAAAAAATVPASPPPASPAAEAAEAAPSPAAPSPFAAGLAPSAAPAGSRVTLPVDSYDPAADACWPAGTLAPYMHVAAACEAVVSTRSRLAIAAILTNTFRSLIALSPEDVLPALYLITGRVAPEWEDGKALSLGGSAVAAALAEATGASKARLSELYRNCGDLGDVAAALKAKQRLLLPPPPLTVRGVFAALRRIAAEPGGPGAAARRRAHAVVLLRAARGPEPRFLVRTLLASMRIGASRRIVLAALSAAAAHAQPGPAPDRSALDDAAAAIATAYALCPSFDVIVPALLEGGPAGLAARCRLLPGVPVSPMLARVARSVADAIAAMRPEGAAVDAAAPFLAEYKYDGQRAQLHIMSADGVASVRCFTRSGEECTAAFPDAAAALLAAAAGGPALEPGGCVLDAELVAVDAAGRLRPFQDLAQRARSGTGAGSQPAVAVCAFVFDCLSLRGETLVDQPLSARRAAMRSALPALPPPGAGAGIRLAEGEELDATSSDCAARTEAVFRRALAGGAEGLMLKRLAGCYEPDKRAAGWVKLKKDYVDATGADGAPTGGGAALLDLVPIGAWRGSGRKHAWHSPYLLACYDPETETWQSVCRVMSGFSDAFYRDKHAYYAQAADDVAGRLLTSKPPYYATAETPDFWFAPTEVWEIRGADLTISPRHAAAAGRVHPTRGISLRFPRFIRTRYAILHVMLPRGMRR